jgi:NagD protein
VIKPESSAARYRAVVFDLDGTLYLDGRPLDGAVSTVETMRASGMSVLFVSNNPLRTPGEYARRLTAIGINADESEVITSTTVTVDWLRLSMPGASVYVIGEPAFVEQLRDAGIAMTSDWNAADVVLASFDRTFEYERWRAANHALRAGAAFIATNPDVTCPTSEGEIPDCGGIIAALEASSGRQVDVVAGKPSAPMSNRIKDELGVSAHEILVVGDRLATDMAMARDAGFAGALVLSGVTRRADLQTTGLRPTHILNSVADLPQTLDLR